MARFPAFEDYEKRGNFKDGIQRCDELLKKNPDNARLLITKLQLVLANKDDGQPVLDKLATIPITELQSIADIEQAVVDSQKDVFPTPSTAGPILSKLWDAAFKSTTSVSAKHDIVGLRFARALSDNRLGDAQQSLIQLKSMLPKNRSIYMAHAAMTQMLSSSNDDLQSRLALMLAKKAVSENFDEDKSLDCRVPGQIFAIQGAQEELGKINGRSFGKSKQAHNALRAQQLHDSNGDSATMSAVDPATTSTADWLSSEVGSLKHQFARLVKADHGTTLLSDFTANSIRLFKTALTSLTTARPRSVIDSCFLAISALVRLFEQLSNQQYLLQAAYLGEILLRHNFHVHEAKLILIYIYVRLGLAPSASRHFSALGIKEIQFDTVAHALFVRLAVTHPHAYPLGRRETFDPLKRTQSALNVYLRYEERLMDNMVDTLSHGQTGMLFDLQELRNQLQFSFSRRQTVLEHRRIARLTDQKVAVVAGEHSVGPRTVANWTATKDNRDFDEAFNYGYHVEKILHTPMPGTATLIYGLAADTVWSISTSQHPLILDLDGLTKSLDEIQSNTEGLLSSEYASTSLLLPTLGVLGALSKPPTTLDAIQASLTSLQTALQALAPPSSSTLAETLKDHYTYLDLLRVVSAATKHIASHTSILTSSASPGTAEKTKATLASINGTVKNVHSQLQASAKSHVQKLNEQDLVRNSLLSNSKQGNDKCGESGDDGLLKKYLFSEDNAEESNKRGKVAGTDKLGLEVVLKEFCTGVVASAKSGWEGIAKVKLVS